MAQPFTSMWPQFYSGGAVAPLAMAALRQGLGALAAAQTTGALPGPPGLATTAADTSQAEMTEQEQRRQKRKQVRTASLVSKLAPLFGQASDGPTSSLDTPPNMQANRESAKRSKQRRQQAERELHERRQQLEDEQRALQSQAR
jgi:hypothetical protein